MSEAAIQSRPGVYRIVNTTNGKQYVGSTFNVKNRRRRHLADLRSGVHHSSHLQRAWNKYGEVAFVFEVVEYVDDKSWLLFVEQAYIDTISKQGQHYNVCMKAGNCAGFKQSDETKQKRASKLRGRIVSPETCKAISDAKKGRTTERMKSAAKQVGEQKKFKLSAWDATHFMGAIHSGTSVTALAAMLPINHHALYRAMREHFPDFASPHTGGRPYAK